MAARTVAAICLALCGAAPAFGAGTFVWDQSDVVVPSGVTTLITNSVADDFTVPGSLPSWQLQFADVWLQDNMELPLDGMVTNFVGTVGWAIYADAAGAPGSLAASGSDGTAFLFGTAVPACCWDTQRVRFRFNPPVTVAPGTYWLAIREGAWGIPAGPDEHYASRASQVRGSAAVVALLPAVPTTFSSAGSSDLAFVVYGAAPTTSLVFASDFEAGGTCAWSGRVGSNSCE